MQAFRLPTHLSGRSCSRKLARRTRCPRIASLNDWALLHFCSCPPGVVSWRDCSRSERSSCGKRTIDANQLYQMSRHFVWLIPVTNLGVFLALGIAGGLLIWVWPRRGRGLVARLLCALTWLPMVLVAFPQIYRLAWLIVTLGIAARLVPTLERHAVGVRRLVRLSLPGVAGLVLILAGSLWGFDRLGEWRERRAPSPPPGTPNVLLIVMDTVAADHLSLYGYQRRTRASSPLRNSRSRTTPTMTVSRLSTNRSAGCSTSSITARPSIGPG